MIQNIPGIIGNINSGGIGGNIKNLLIVAKSIKSKMSILAKSKKSTLIKDFVKANFTIDFLTLKAKKTFIYL